MLGQESLQNYYKHNFLLMQHYNYSLTDLEGMIPFEREFYMQLLGEFIDQQIEEKKKYERRNPGPRTETPKGWS